MRLAYITGVRGFVSHMLIGGGEAVSVLSLYWIGLSLEGSGAG